MKKSNADPELADRLHSVTIHLLRRLRKEDDASGLSAPRLSALSVLAFAGPRTLGELAAAEQIKPPSMTRLIREMSRDGLVETAPHPEDGRAILVCATKRGVGIIQKGRSRRVRALNAMLSGMSTRERNTLEDAIALLENAMNR